MTALVLLGGLAYNTSPILTFSSSGMTPAPNVAKEAVWRWSRNSWWRCMGVC